MYATDTERKQDFAEVLETYNLLVQVYRECGYELLDLRKLTSRARAELILLRLRLPLIGSISNSN